MQANLGMKQRVSPLRRASDVLCCMSKSLLFAAVSFLGASGVAAEAASLARAADGSRYQVEADTLIDRRTGLEWQLSDNGFDIAWDQARDYCVQQGNGWRLPDLDELASIDDSTEAVACGLNFCHAAAAFHLSGGWFWSGQLKDATQAWGYNLDIGRRDSAPTKGASYGRALCVRHAGRS